MRRPIELHVDRLVLEGLDGTDAHEVGSVLQRELARLLDRRGLPQIGDDRSIAMIDAGTAALGHGGARDLGLQVAGRVYGSLQR